MGGEPARLALQVDSLRQTIRRYEDGNRRLRDAQGERNAVLAALEARRGGLQDSLAAVERQLARVDAELQRREQRGDLGDYVNYVWYVVVPWLGALWAQDS
jgi:DNA repair exonuclease SbcCD ATPase subunit